MTASPEATYAALYHAIQADVGIRLFTVSVLDRAANLAQRAYSSHPVDYPVTGTKPIGSDAWSHRVIDAGETFVANSTAEFAPFFSDHALIQQLGCQSAVNIPVANGHEVIGTVNLLDVEGYFTPERLAKLHAIIAAQHPVLVAALLAAALNG